MTSFISFPYTKISRSLTSGMHFAKLSVAYNETALTSMENQVARHDLHQCFAASSGRKRGRQPGLSFKRVGKEAKCDGSNAF